ncbi:fatty-acyl-CoA synthase [Tersicoccus solisilvae]|uniref:Fatty-acyl-CoA synthase n=1 Tax=Tersicoccus solisilvae TaxID=1882339 RepID=A0ABQ1PPZ3_9MICC|nr:long-chain fatty acid--CoA ligase [Tersicoccus solisilvae]GGD01109.1 fatty-acyl-CoA synthase [Tersicoccus solisilvae]
MLNNGIGSWPHRRLPKSAGRTALVCRGRTISYDELADRVDRLAAVLRGHGVRPGDRVAYLGENHPAFLETLFAAGVCGAVFVPLNTRLAAPELQFALTDSGATVLVYATSLTGLALPGSEGTAVQHRVRVDDGPDPRFTSTPPAEDVDLEEALAAAEPVRHDVPVTLEDPAMILYTSGTTGRPKGAVLTHGNVTWNCMNVLVDFDLASTDVSLMISPLFHVAALDMGALPTLLKGGTLVLEPRFEPGEALRLIEEHRATAISGVPTTYQLLAEHPDWATRDISSLTKLTCGGSAVPHRVLAAYEERGLSFTMGYGMTETAPGATTLPVRYSASRAGSGGLPHFFTDVRIADPLGEELPPGQTGEIQICGPNVIHEYWQRPDATAESFDAGGWFKSGDMGHLDDDGFLFISDRLKDMIISGGENIYPAEVEQLIAELDAVAAVAVIGVPDEKWGEVGRAIVTVRDGTSLTAEEVLGHLDGRLARYKIPKSVVFADQMPRTASGKIRKADLRKQFG